MARTVADAWVSVAPSGFDVFGPKTKAGIEAALRGIQANIAVGANTKPAQLDIAALKAKLDALGARSLGVNVDTKAAQAKLLALQATLASIGTKLNSGKTFDDAGLLRMASSLSRVDDGMDKLSRTTAVASSAVAASGAAATQASGRWGILRTQVALFGGLAAVSGLHLLIDGVVELGAVLIPAALAFGAFGVAAIPTVQAIAKQMQNLNTVSQALGTNIYPLSGGFSDLADAVKPKVMQLFGEALVLVNSKTGQFQTLATGAGTVLDHLGARFVAAITSGKGLGAFMENAVKDLAKFGDVIGNVSGIFGNFFKVMPGYAEILLGLLDGFTKLTEAVTGNGFVQGILSVGLALHGAFVYGGLLVTGLLALRGPLTSLATWAAGGIAKLLGLGIAFTAVAAEEGVLAAATVALSAVSPFVWVAVAVGALAGLVIALGRSGDAATSFNKAIQQTINNAPLLSLQTTLQSAASRSADQLAASNRQVNSALKETGPAIGGVASRFQSSYNPALDRATQLSGQYAGGLTQVHQQQTLVNSRVAELAKTFGGTTGAWAGLNAAGITSSQILDKNKANWAATKVQVQAASDAFSAMAVGVGRNGAAVNALGNQFLTSTLPALQKVTGAEDSLISLVTSGRVAFDNFQQSIEGTTAKFKNPSGLADAFKLAKGNLSGLNEQSLAFANVLYNISIPALQKTITSVQQQGISTSALTKVVATGASQMLAYTGKNVEARSTIVSLINNALGPGTVSLQTLNGWVKNNSTSLTGFNNIVAQSTIQAGTLASVLKNQLNAQFYQDILQSSGASRALKIYTGDITSNTTTTANGKRDRQNLINDLVTSGLSAKQARDYVNGLTGAIKNVPGSKAINITVHGKGSWEIFQASNPGARIQAKLLAGTAFGGAAGGVIPGYGPGRDTVMAALSPGEGILVPEAVQAIGPHNVMAINQHFAGGRKSTGMAFAGGGLVSNLGGMPQWMNTSYHDTEALASNITSQALANALNTAIATARAAAQAATIGTGAVGSSPARTGSIAVEQAYAASLLAQYGWGQNQMPSLISLWNRESGWNPYAVNSSSGAAGIPQALGHGHVFNLGDYQNQIIWGLNYIKGRYGSPAGAWGHEVAAGWYDTGGYLPPGLSMSYNGTGQYEKVSAPNQSGGADLTPGDRAILERLDRLIQVSMAAPAAYSRGLNGNMSAAAGVGYYSGR